jgi:hypothetical protein
MIIEHQCKQQQQQLFSTVVERDYLQWQHCSRCVTSAAANSNTLLANCVMQPAAAIPFRVELCLLYALLLCLLQLQSG